MPPSKTKRTATPKQTKPRPPDGLSLVCFQYDEPSVPGTRSGGGSFQIVVRARSYAKALDASKARLRELRATTSLFDTPCTVILDHLIEISGVAEKAALVNYVSKMPVEGGADGDAQILCGVPEQPDLPLPVFGPREKKGEDVEPFVDFGGKAAQDYLSKAIAKNGARR
jgi:hypothetical protein